MDAVSAPESQTVTDDEEVLDFLRKLKRVVDEDLLDQPQRIEEIMGFRVTGWRDEAEDNAYSSVRYHTPNGSFGGMVAFVTPPKRRLNAALPSLHFSAVFNSKLKPSIKSQHLEQVFGVAIDEFSTKDFHHLSGGQIRYLLGSKKKIELIFSMHSFKRYVVNGISVLALSN
mgnify:FL=1